MARGTAAPRRGRFVRVLCWCGLGAAGLVALSLGGALWLLGHLDHPGLKARIQALALEHAQLALDYDALAVSPFEGVHARGLRILQPARFRGVAQEFLRIGALDVDASLVSIPLRGIDIAALRVRDVDVTLVRDARDGADTLGTLFPPDPQAAAEPATPLSHTLATLPEVALRHIDVTGVRGRMIETRPLGPTREQTLASLRLSGALHGKPHSLQGTRLQLEGAPRVRIEVRDGELKQVAELGLTLGVRADAARALSLETACDLHEQNLSATWTGSPELVRAKVRVTFDERGGRTLVAVPELLLVGAMASAAGEVTVFDEPPARVVGNGRVAIDVKQLPLRVEGVTLDALTLMLEAKQLALQADRIGGTVSFQGGVKQAGLARDGQSAALSDVRLSGRGTFDAPSGQFRATADVRQLALDAPDARAQLEDVHVDLEGSVADEAGAQKAEARLAAKLAKGALTAAGGSQVALVQLALGTKLAGPVADLLAARLPALETTLAIERITADEGARRAVVERLSLAASGEGLAPDDASPSGFSGPLRATLSLSSLRVFEARSHAAVVRLPPKAKAALAADGLDLRAALPLSLATIDGKLTLAALTASDLALGKLALDFRSSRPLGFVGEETGPSALHAAVSLGSLRAGESRGTIDRLELTAERRDPRRYALSLDGDASAVVIAGDPIPEHVRATVQGEADRGASSGKLSVRLAGARGAEVALELDAAVAREGGRLRYQAQVDAAKLDAFAGFLHRAEPSTRAVKSEGARLRASARGDLTGVVRVAPDGWPEPTEDPLRMARGEQSLSLELRGLAYQTEDLSVSTPKLSLGLESVHRDRGAGRATFRVAADTLKYESGGDALSLEGLDQQVVATFDKPPDQGLVDVHAKLALGSASQSYFPAYRVSDLRFETHVQVDHLRSIFLRELALANPATGTSLSARGAIELRAPAAAGDDRTIAGREALALEGKLEQALEPMQQLGFASHASGTIRVPFRLESGGLLSYRLLARLEAQAVSFSTKDRAIGIDELQGAIPIIEEFAVLPGGVVVSAGPRASPLTEMRFFDVHPFLSGSDYVTARSIALRGLAPFGPFAANLRLDRSDFLIDQLQVGFGGGQVVGQVRIAYRDGDPLVRLRVNATGVRSGKTKEVLDANASLVFQPKVMTLDGKVQLVRASRAHLLDILDVVDPFHESVSANRVRKGLLLGYPKFVRFLLHDGALDTKVELGGVAQVVRIDEIKAVPLGPIMQRYLVPTIADFVRPPEAATEPAPMAAVPTGETP